MAKCDSFILAIEKSLFSHRAEHILIYKKSFENCIKEWNTELFLQINWNHINIYWTNRRKQLVCFDLLTLPKMPFKVTHRKEVTRSIGSCERKSRGQKLADEMGRGKKKSHYTLIDWRTEESDLWTGWQLFPLDDYYTGHSKESGSDTSRSPDIGRSCGGVEVCPYHHVGVWR